ncbi:hypothetical protein GQ44DRAFT_831325 [Phaeosphaeriaceae sp. PMI808]|nr:hypothetical protein GQ44DRAFT_831325 [Phaeosphaeriaceae sp. PMI808]
MADYSKQTVAQLRQLLKERGISSTGLTRKAHIIEKLEKVDADEGESEGVSDTGDAQPDLEAQGQEEETEDAPGAALSEAGEPVTQAVENSDSAVPVATIDVNRETVSHIDGDVPPPNQNIAIEQSAEDTTMAEEPGAVQPTEVFSATPADPEDVVGPKITEPKDEAMADEKQDGLGKDELPDAPGPAAEALRFARQDKTPTPGIIEEPSVERAELSTIPERSTAETSRLNTEELEADSRKRKRRSGSPDLPTQDIRAKKHRPSQEPAPEVYLKEDEDVAMEQRQPEEVTHDNGTHAAEAEESPVKSPTSEGNSKPLKKENTDRYKNLVKPSADGEYKEALQDDRPIAAALHPATPALYIRNFMRPLRPEPLRAHLVALASSPPSSPDASIVEALFLDAMKTHALVLFTNTTAASRVRASLHGSIWPPEGNRKELWVDFIPSESVTAWIQQEEDAITAEKNARASGHPIPAKRFEVIYPTPNTAVFQEIGSNAPPDAPRGPRQPSDTRRPLPSQLPPPLLSPQQKIPVTTSPNPSKH